MFSSSSVYDTSSPETAAGAGNSISSSEHGTQQRLEPDENSFLCSELQEAQNYQYQEDVTLILGDTEVKAHRSVLVSCPYFMALFDSGMRESLTGEVKMYYDDMQAMKHAIEFIYTKQLELTLDTVTRYLVVADYLQFSSMTDYCDKFLQETEFTMETCVQIMVLSSRYNLDTYTKIYMYVAGHLRELMSGHQLLELTNTAVLTFLSDRTLSYMRPEEFFNFIVRWTKVDKKERQRHFPELFQALDLNCASLEFLNRTVKKHPLVLQFPQCKRQCSQVGDLALTGGAPIQGSFFMTDAIFVGGGQGKGVSSFRKSRTVMAYLKREKRWAYLPDMPLCIQKPQMTFTSCGKLLVIETDVCGSSEILCYYPCWNNWNTFNIVYPDHISHGYRFHALTTHNGHIFIVASFLNNARIIQCTVELFEVSVVKFGRPGSVSLEPKFMCLTCRKDTRIQVTCGPLLNNSNPNGNLIYMKVTECWEIYRENSLFVYNVEGEFGRDLEIHYTKMGRPLTFSLTKGLLNACPGEDKATLFSIDRRMTLATRYYAIPRPPPAMSDSSEDSDDDTFNYYDGWTLKDSDGGTLKNSDGGTLKNSESNTLKDTEGDASMEFSDHNILENIVGDSLVSFDDAQEDNASRGHSLKAYDSWEDTTFLCVDDKLYAFGGRMGQKAAVCYSFSDTEWTALDSMPTGMTGAGAASGTVPCNMLRCHAHCPHCRFQQPSSDSQDSDTL